MFNYKKTAAAAAVALSLGLALPAHAATTGTILGNAVETDGDQISNATITIKNKETGLTRTVQSDESGSFRFPLLPPGTYIISANKNGFQQTLQDNVNVKLGGSSSVNIQLVEDNVERIEVTGSSIALVDVTSSTTGISVDAVTLDKLPVPRNLSSVALLAPGTTEGDSDFGDGGLTSIGGSSVAENAFYINGLNITNFRTGVGSSEPPFDMYDSFEIKTGGYSAEYGRVTGGIINTKIKSGTNEFKAGINAYWEPEALRSYKPSSKRENGTYRINNDADEVTNLDVNVWASGALIEDKLFFYVSLKSTYTYRS